MENKPLVGILATFVKDYIPLVDDLYYCERIPPPRPSPALGAHVMSLTLQSEHQTHPLSETAKCLVVIESHGLFP
jgi:hypothetical protein